MNKTTTAQTEIIAKVPLILQVLLCCHLHELEISRGVTLPWGQEGGKHWQMFLCSSSSLAVHLTSDTMNALSNH